MATYTVEIPDFLPTRLNVLLRQHWAARRRTLRSEAGLVGHYARAARVPPARGRRRVSLRFESPRTPGDPDARLKGLLDGLCRAGCLIDDASEYLELGSVESVRGQRRRTVITLRDLP
jgi:hypothetical protein